MTKPPELWAFILANALLFLISSLLAVLSYIAYRQSKGKRMFLTATAGFWLVVLGGLVEPLYQLGMAGDYNISGTELLWLQTGEGILIASGLGLLYFAIYNSGSGGATTDYDTRQADDQDFSYQYPED